MNPKTLAIAVILFFAIGSLFEIVNASISCDADIAITHNQVIIKLTGVADKEMSYQIRKAADTSNNGYVTEEEAKSGISNLKAVFGFDLEKQPFLNIDGLVVKIDSESDKFPNLPGEVLSPNPVVLISEYKTDPNVVSGYFTTGNHRIIFNFKTNSKVSFSLTLPEAIDVNSITYSKGTQDSVNKRQISGELDSNEPLIISFGAQSTSSTSPLSEGTSKRRITGFESQTAILSLLGAGYLLKRKFL
ncbi:MAG: hypothetical protein QXJ68_06535 [Methanocellales archaeon]